jgi:hypothetical protein
MVQSFFVFPTGSDAGSMPGKSIFISGNIQAGAKRRVCRAHQQKRVYAQSAPCAKKSVILAEMQIKSAFHRSSNWRMTGQLSIRPFNSIQHFTREVNR